MKNKRNHKTRNQRRRASRLFKRERIDHDLTTRSLAVRADSFDEKSRSVEAVLATDSPVQVFDYRRYEAIDEILVMPRQADLPTQIPMLESHQRYSLDDVLGSVRGLRVDGNQIIARLHFAENDERAERAMNKVKGGHVRDVSVGYRVDAYVDIEPGKTARVAGRNYTAGPRVLRVSTNWRAKEGSLVPIGADELAKIREESAEKPPTRKAKEMNELLRRYLESLGLARDADDAAAWTFYESLDQNQRAFADSLDPAAQNRQPAAGRSDPVGTPPAGPPASTPAGATPEPTPAPAPAPTPAPARTELEQAREQAIADERERRRAINELAGDDIPAELTERAISEGWDIDRYREAALRALRDNRPEPPSGNGHRVPAAHSRSRENDMTLAALTGALMVREGTPLDGDYAGRNQLDDGRRFPVAALERQFVGVFLQDVDSDERQQAMELAHRYSSMSMVDICRRACELDGHAAPMEHEDAIQLAIAGSREARPAPAADGQRAASSGALLAMFTTNINAQLLQSYIDAPDTTMGWMDETDVANFLPHERAAMGKFGSLKRQPTGLTAQHLDIDANKETSSIDRFTGQWRIDEIDLINDRYGAIDQMSPRDIGFTAAQLRPDLVYSLVRSNPTLQTTGVPVFDASQGNLNTDALNEANLEKAISSMMQQRQRGRPLNIKARALVVNPQLWFTAERLLQSTERRGATSSEGTLNVLRNAGVQMLRADDRLGPNGVVDPRTGTSYAGSDTLWYLFARPRENGAKTGVVKYRRGTGRAPRIRGFVLDRGQWGLGWDVNHDLGVAFDDYRGSYRGNA